MVSAKLTNFAADNYFCYMTDEKKSKLQDLKKELKSGDKLEQLVLDFAVRKTAGSREDLNGVFYSKNGSHVIMASKSLSGHYDVCDGVREIDGDAFWGCAYLESITLPDGLETVGHEAFGRCISLKSVELPATVKKMGANPFIGLSNISVKSKSASITSDGKAVYANGGKSLVSFISDDSVYVVPEGVEEIGEKAFFGKKQLRWITLPKTLKMIDDEAFFDCDSLQTVTIPAGVESIGACAFGDSMKLGEIEFEGIPQKMKRSMLAGCERLRTISIPAGSIAGFKKLVRDFDDRVVERHADGSAPTEAKPKDKKKDKAEKKDKSADKKEKHHDGKKESKAKEEPKDKKNVSPMYK